MHTYQLTSPLPPSHSKSLVRQRLLSLEERLLLPSGAFRIIGLGGISIWTDATGMAFLQCCTQVVLNEGQHKVKCHLDWSWLYLGSASKTNPCMPAHIDTLYGTPFPSSLWARTRLPYSFSSLVFPSSVPAPCTV